MAVLLRVQSHGEVPLSNLATFLARIDRAYVRFAATEVVSEHVRELEGTTRARRYLDYAASEIERSARGARRFVAIEDRLVVRAVRLASPGELDVAAGIANAAKGTAGALEKAATLKQTVRQAEADTRVKRASADSAEIEVDLKAAASDAELAARLAEARRRQGVAQAEAAEALARKRFADDRAALEIRREAIQVVREQLAAFREVKEMFPGSGAVEAIEEAVANSVQELLSPTVTRLTDGAEVLPLDEDAS